MNILLPIETTNRELDFKLFLAVMYSKAGRDVYVGHHDIFHKRLIPRIRGGLYVGKTMFPALFPHEKGRLQTQLVEHDLRIVHLDEEGAVYKSSFPEDWAVDMEARLDVNFLDGGSRLCTWGQYQADHYTGLRPDFAGRIVATGHPRFDIYKPPYREIFAEEAEALRKKYGKFLLVSCNHPWANHADGPKRQFDLVSKNTTVEKRLHNIGRWRSISNSLTELVYALHHLSAEFPDWNFVVRPHPSENWEFHRQAFKGIPNVKVVHDGAIGAWLFAASALIQDGCTTAIEGFLAGTPVLNFKPRDEAKLESKLINQFGHRCRDVDDIRKHLQKLDKGELSPQTEVSDFGRSFMANVGTDLSSFHALSEAMEATENEVAGPVKTCDQAELRRLGHIDTLENFARMLVRPLFPARLKAYLATRNKYKGFGRKLIDGKLAIIQDVLQKRVRYEQFGEGLIKFSAS